MRTAFKLLAIFAAVTLVAADTYKEEDGVLVLDASTYEQAISEFDPLLVEFYAPWCGHCQRLAPEYAKAAKALKAKGIRIAKVDAEQDENKALAQQVGVKSYPTLKWVVGGNAQDYQGPRTAKGIVNWISKRAGPPATGLGSVEEVKAFLAENDIAVIGFFADEDSKAGKSFIKAAKAVDTASFGIVSDLKVAAEMDAKMESMTLYKENGKDVLGYPGKLRKGPMVKWIKNNQLPLVIPFTEENADMIFGSPIKVHYLLFADKQHESAVQAFGAVAKANQGKLLFVVVDSNQKQVLEYFKVTESDFPAAYIMDMPEGGQMKQYELEDDEITETTLADFAQGFVAGTLKRTLKTETAEEDDLEHDVAILRGSTIAEVATDPNKDVLVEFYAPWCGHCKKLAPIYEKVGEAFADEDSLVVAKMDASANDIPPALEGVDVQGFPTLYFFPAGGKAHVYEGPRDEQGMVNWLKKNAKTLSTGDL